MTQKHQEMERGGHGRVIWDTGSSLYDSYELASLGRILARQLAGLPSSNEPPRQKGPATTGSAPPPTEGRNKQAVVVGARRKVTLRALFRGVASWAAARPRLQPRACACVGAAPPPGASRIGSEPAV